MVFLSNKMLQNSIKYANKIINICIDPYQFFETVFNYHIICSLNINRKN